MAAGPMRLFRFARRSFDVDEAQTSIDSLGRDFRMGEGIDVAYAVAGTGIGALCLSVACAWKSLVPRRTLLRSLLCGRKRETPLTILA